MIVPVGVTARNEAPSLPVYLQHLRRAIRFAEQKLPVTFEIHVLLNDTTDDSEEILSRESNIQVWQTPKGLVEAQRFFASLQKEKPFVIFSDADILMEENSLAALCESLLSDDSVQISYVEKKPLPPRNKNPLAQSLYLYNLNNGYQSKRHYLNGQLFAIRHWNIPTVDELSWDKSKDSAFLNLQAGIRCDDIYLSRDILARFGPEAIRCVEASLWYRPPETIVGMYRKYQRMRLEIERLHVYFPPTVAVHSRWGQRRLVLGKILSRELPEVFYYTVFLGALYACKMWYFLEKTYYSYFSKSYCPTWKPVVETKGFT